MEGVALFLISFNLLLILTVLEKIVKELKQMNSKSPPQPQPPGG